MKKRMLFLLILLFAVLVIPVGTQTTSVSDVIAESQNDLELASIPEPPDPPTLPDPEDYTYHNPIVINLETWDDIIEEFDGMGTQDSPLKIRGLYFEGSPEYLKPDSRIIIDTSLDGLEDAPYIDIKNCLFIGDYSDLFIGIYCSLVTGRLKIKNCVFIGNTYGVYLDNVEGMLNRRLIVEDCLFYEGLGAGVYIYGDDGGADITVKDCNFYAVERGVYASFLYPGSRLEIDGCKIYSGNYGVEIYKSIGAIMISDNHIDYCNWGIVIGQSTQGVIVNDNEISHCSNEAIWIHNGASFNTIKYNYIHDIYMEHSVLIEGDHNIIRANKFEDVGITIYCFGLSHENEITWNVFLEGFSPVLAVETGWGNVWDYNYYYDYEGDGTEPYGISALSGDPENYDIHPFGPNVPYIPPTPPDPEDYTYHASIRINAETWDDVVEEFEGMGTRWNPLKIRGFYFKDTGGIGQSCGVFINSDLENVYIDIEDCLFIELNEGVLSYPSSGRVRVKNCVFIDNKHGVYFSEHAEQTVEDCMFYGGSDPYGAAVFIEEAYDVTVKDCTFYNARKSVYISWLSPTSWFKMVACYIYGSSCGIEIKDSIPGEDGAIIIRNNHIDYCIRGLEIGQGSEYSQGSQGVIVVGNKISHCIDEGIWLQTGASFNIIKDNYFHDTSIDNWWSISIHGHHNTIVSNKFESSGMWAYGFEIYCYIHSYENEIRWNVLDSLKPYLAFDIGEGNLWEYNYYSDYEGDGTEPYNLHTWPNYPVSQDLHPLGPELSFYYWLELLCQYPCEVLQMWRWLI